MEQTELATCPVCKDICNDPYECLQCLQLYCKSCQLSLNFLCIKCKGTLGFESSKNANNLFSYIQIYCKYCQVIIIKGDQKNHELLCENYKIKCKYLVFFFTGESGTYDFFFLYDPLR